MSSFLNVPRGLLGSLGQYDYTPAISRETGDAALLSVHELDLSSQSGEPRPRAFRMIMPQSACRPCGSCPWYTAISDNEDCSSNRGKLPTSGKLLKTR